MSGKKNFTVVALVCGLFVTIIFSPTQSIGRTLSIGNILAHNSIPSRGLIEVFKPYVEEKSGGALKIEVFTASQLGRAPEQVEGVKMGTQDMFWGHLSWWEAHVEELSVVSIPFLFDDTKHYERWIEKVLVTDLQAQLIKNANQRFISLGSKWHMGPPKCILAKRPIFTPEDINGLRLRLWPARMIQKSWGGMGAQIHTIDWSEAYLALKQGMVEAITALAEDGWDSKFTEVVKYVTELNQVPMHMAITINEKVWQGLTPAEQKILIDGVNKSGEWYAEQVKTSDNDIIENKLLKVHNAFYIRVNRQPFVDKFRRVVLPKLVSDGLAEEAWVEKVESTK